MTEQTDAAEGLTENERDRIWYALATTRCGPLHADDGWTPGEPCESCGDLANEVTPYLSRIVERILAAREAAARAEALRGILFRVETACDGYSHLMDEDVPGGVTDLAAYEQGAADAAEAIRAAARIARTDGAGS